MPDFTCLDEVLFAKVLAPLIVLLYVCVTDAQMDRFISYCVLYYTVLLRLCSQSFHIAADYYVDLFQHLLEFLCEYLSL